jgi:putative membrane protein
LSNFAGWFLVALILILALQYLASAPAPAHIRDWGRRTFPCQALLGPALYLGILGFNLGMTFLIGETRLEWAGVFIFLPFLTWLGLKHLPGSGQVW